MRLRLFLRNFLQVYLFHSKWINADDKFKKAMKLFMENNKKLTEILAFGLVKVNLGTFTSICNFAYTLYAVFQRLNK